MCSLSHLSVKDVFLFAIMLARRVGDLEAFMADLPYAIFCNGKVSLCLHMKFVPNSAQLIHLLVFFLKPPTSSKKRRL